MSSIFKIITLESQYTSMNVYNNSNIPVRKLLFTLISKDEPVGFNTNYIGENGLDDVVELIGNSGEISQNVIKIPFRITLIGNVILNNNQFALIKTEANLISKTETYFFKSKVFWGITL